jgi:hypothetical protein
MPVKSPKTSPLSPSSNGLASVGGFPLGGDSSRPHSKKPPWQYSRVAESLANDPEFIKARIRIDRFITTVVDTKADNTNIEALCTDLESTTTQINISTF